MLCGSVDGRRLPDVRGREDETGLWRQPPGSWRWVLNGVYGDRVLEGVLPTAYPEGPGRVKPYMMCHCPVEGTRFGTLQWEWDGNVEAPTLSPSILVETLWGEDSVRVFWHGYMRAGRFEGCE